MFRFDELVDDVKGVAAVAFDTTAVVYFLSEREPWASLVRVVLERADRRMLTVVVPLIVQLELLAKVFKDNDELERMRITAFLESAHFIRQVPFDREVMLKSAEIRGKLGLKLPDCMVLGSACAAGVGAVVGNDARFRALGSVEAQTLSFASKSPLPRYLHLNDYVELESK